MSLDCPVYCHQYTESKRVPEHRPSQVVYSETLALKPWLLYQITRSLTITKMIFFVESSAISYCPLYGEPLSYRDSCERLIRLEGGMNRRFLIRRLKCSSCGKLHRELPDFLVPYKHYASEVISGVLGGIVTPDDDDSAHYLCEMTMHR